MRILITGAAGMVGRKLTERLVAEPELMGKTVTAAVLHDIVAPTIPEGAPFTVTTVAGDLADPAIIDQMMADRPDVIFHLAAVVSGEAETDFDKGYSANFDGVLRLFEAVRAAGNRPKMVFTSSIAVFGAPFPDVIDDAFHHTPLTSYGAQKACGELLLADYSRREFFDGIGIRLPTIVVRPGKPNKAASSFFSGIIREPLAGVEAICPVDRSVLHWIASPASAVGFLIHAANLPAGAAAPRPNLTMPGLGITVGEMVADLAEVAGGEVADLIRWEPDPFIQSIVKGWPRTFNAKRALDLGFTAETDFKDIITAHMADMAA
ncbi:MAG: D-erythronate dehydrogenase [Pseudomonadota bacterium]